MYYDSIENKHGLKHDPFKALIAPRPIGWISSISADGICNLAPYSFFNAVSDRPPYVMFSSADFKDSVRNIEQTGEFTCSMATWDTRGGMNISSASVPADTDEFSIVGSDTNYFKICKNRPGSRRVPPRSSAATGKPCRYPMWCLAPRTVISL